MENLNFLKNDLKQAKKKKIIKIVIIIVIVIALITAFVLIFKSCDNKTDKTITTTTEKKTTTAISSVIKEDKQADSVDSKNIGLVDQTGASVNISNIESKTGQQSGIDVSKWQGNIDWAKVKSSGIDFAIIRIGFRGEDGVIYKDSYADYNIQQAIKNNILVGVYFYSTAVNTSESKEEANFTINAIKAYSISYPVVYDCENYNVSSSRMKGISKKARTDNALMFLNTVKAAGYEGMLYSATSELENSYSWDTSRLEASFKIWVARYPSTTYPTISVPPYSGKYAMWQYTNKGSVSGIIGDVDLIVSYFSKTTSTAKDVNATTAVATTKFTLDGQTFTTVNDKVTAKELTNLRDAPNSKTSNVIAQLKNGEFITRIGISDKGWSRVTYNGKTLYCVTSYLTDKATTLPNVTTTTTTEAVTEGE